MYLFNTSAKYFYVLNYFYVNLMCFCTKISI